MITAHYSDAATGQMVVIRDEVTAKYFASTAEAMAAVLAVCPGTREVSFFSFDGMSLLERWARKSPAEPLRQVYPLPAGRS
jgi:hypothetical protein